MRVDDTRRARLMVQITIDQYGFDVLVQITEVNMDSVWGGSDQLANGARSQPPSEVEGCDA